MSTTLLVLRVVYSVECSPEDEERILDIHLVAVQVVLEVDKRADMPAVVADTVVEVVAADTAAAVASGMAASTLEIWACTNHGDSSACS